MRTVAIALVAALAAPAAASAAGAEPTPSTPSPTPPSQSAPGSSATTPAPASSTPAPAAKQDDKSLAVWPLAILAALVVLSAVFAGLAWWFGWSSERFLGRGRASWSSFEEFGDWIRSGY